jgi:hypothetical protein
MTERGLEINAISFPAELETILAAVVFPRLLPSLLTGANTRIWV